MILLETFGELAGVALIVFAGLIGFAFLIHGFPFGNNGNEEDD